MVSFPTAGVETFNELTNESMKVRFDLGFAVVFSTGETDFLRFKYICCHNISEKITLLFS